MSSKESYTDYLARVSGLPIETFTPLTEAEWTKQTQPKQTASQPKPQPAPKPIPRSAEERIHLQELAETRARETELLANPPKDGFAKLGLTAVENAFLVRNSSEERLKDALASDAENKAAIEAAQQKLDADVANAEHYREMAHKRLIEDRIAERNKKAQE